MVEYVALLLLSFVFLLKLLPLQDIQVNRRGIHHCTSLLWAAGKGSLSLVQLLLRLLFGWPRSESDLYEGELPV